jgi:hypothetical protein
LIRALSAPVDITEELYTLAELAREGVPVPVISLKLKRSIASIHAKLTELGLTAPPGA